MKATFLTWLNRFLVVDVFVVLLGFAWFAIALFGRAMAWPLGWELWYSLWQPLFTPAIGILMAGALLSGLINWVSKRLDPAP